MDKRKTLKGKIVFILISLTLLIWSNAIAEDMTFDLTQGLNGISLPFEGTGITDAEELCQSISYCESVSYWDVTTQAYVTYEIGLSQNNFILIAGHPYFVSVTQNTSWIISGDLPDTVSFNLITTTGTDINAIAVPLNRLDITTAEELANIVPNTDTVWDWDEIGQGYSGHPKGAEINDFSVFAGYPYFVNNTAETNWSMNVALNASIIAGPTTEAVPFDVTFDASVIGGTPPYIYSWDVDGDATPDDARKNFIYTYTTYGIYNASLTVTDNAGRNDTTYIVISALLAPSCIGSGSPDNGGAPLNVTFSCIVDDADGNIVQYEWDFDGDGNYDWSDSASCSTSYQYVSNGAYPATLRVTDNEGMTCMSIENIAIGNPPIASASASPMTGTAPLDVNFTGTGTDTDGSIVLYEWDFDGDGTYDWNDPNSGNTLHTYNSSGVFSAALRVTDNDGIKDMTSILISIAGAPISLPRAYPMSGDLPLTVTFFADGDDLDGTPETFYWDYDGDGLFDNQLLASMNSTYTYTEAGTYNAVLRIFDNDVLMTEASITINVNDPNPQGIPIADANANPENGAALLQVALIGNGTDIAGNITNYEWDFEDDGIYDWMENSQPDRTMGLVIDVGSTSMPDFVDIDSDGDLDLFVGEPSGEIYYFRNDGDNSKPLWTEMGIISDSVSSVIDVGFNSKTSFLDIDSDGDFDLFSGNGDGTIYFYRNDGDSSLPVWTSMGLLTDSSSATIDVGYQSSPDFKDIDNDGDLDMFIGGDQGTIYYYRNDGDSSLPVWTDSGTVSDSTSSIIDAGSRSNPDFADIDNDGDFDMFVGNDQGDIYYYRNDGDISVPVWTGMGLLADKTGNTIDIGSSSNPDFADIDNDGDFDMFIGTGNRFVYYYHNEGSSSSPSWLLVSTKYDYVGVDSYSAPAFADIDNDGLQDMFVGSYDGRIYHIYNGISLPIRSTSMQAGDYSYPVFVDIDGDGDHDLFTGEYEGMITYYRNDGNSSLSVWTEIGPVTDITENIIDIGSYSSADFVDIDSDGDFDMFIGNSSGTFNYYRNDGDINSPVWIDMGLLTDSSSSTINVYSRSTPVFVDIDNDGDFDMFSGTLSGYIYFSRNDGDSSAPLWNSVEIVKSGLSNIYAGSYSSLDFADIDSDGDFDMFIGSNSGNVYYYRNEGDNTSPAWIMIEKLEDTTENIIFVGSASSPCFTDIDNDGDFDMFIGDSNGFIYYYRNDGDNILPIWMDTGKITSLTGSVIKEDFRSSPDFADIDNDGDFDMFVGNSNSTVHYFRNDGDSSSPLWTDIGLVSDSWEMLVVGGQYSTPTLVDIDNDGDFDIYLGDSNGTIFYYRNDGDSSAPLWFNNGAVKDTNGSNIDVGIYSSPEFQDIDNDGDFDMLIGNNDGTIFYYRNIGRSTSPEWVLISDNYKSINVGSASTPEFADIDNDGDQDLFSGNSFGYIYFYPNLGDTIHIYSNPGTYNAVFRVTDNDGYTDTDTVSISVYPSGSPTAQALTETTDVNAPFNVLFQGKGNDPDGSIILYEWDFDGDGNYDSSSSTDGDASYNYNEAGSFTASLRVTDNDGKMAIDSVTINVYLNVSATRTDIFTPAAGETGTITSTCTGAESIVTISIVDGVGNVVRTIVNNETRPEGIYSDIWDGKDEAGDIVGEGVYYFLIEYTVNGQTYLYDLRETADYSEISPTRTWPTDFYPFEDENAEITYSISSISEVSMYLWRRNSARLISSLEPVRTMFTREPKRAGSHTEIWDGVNDRRTLVSPWSGGYPITLWTFELPDNAIIIMSNKPVITDVTADPNFFAPAYNPYGTQNDKFTSISLNLSKTADLEIKIRNHEGLVIRTMYKTALPAGINTFIWDGRDISGIMVEEGTYTITLTAIDSIGNRSLQRYAAVMVSY